MSQQEVITAQNVDLSNCDREAIHIPGAIQPHGILFAIEEAELRIVQVSNNTYPIIGIHPQELLEKPLSELISFEQINAIRECISQNFEFVNPLTITIKQQQQEFVFDGIVHRSEGLLILELEPNDNEQQANFFSFHHLVYSPINKIQKSFTSNELYQIVVQEVRKLTGFDRVMLYKFDKNGSGEVVAEDKLKDLVPYLGLHYPVSDIPKQARKLYVLNRLRLITDCNYKPAEIVPSNNPFTNAPLDLSFSVLRSVSPLHVEYLNNMRVTASMSISLIKDHQLWGLIACHHYSPKYVPYTIRTACEFLGQIMSIELTSKEENEDLDYKIQIKSIHSKIVEAISPEKNFLDCLVKSESKLLNLVSAQGAVLLSDKECVFIGTTPGEAEIQDLIEWLETQFDHDIFYTDSLCQVYPTAYKFKEVASGLLALEISRVPQNYILWFRPEVIQTVNWGGNPNKPVEIAQDGSLCLSPRKSFELWQETVQGESLPWKRCEIDIALELKSAIIGIVLRKAEELAKINFELERSNNELDAFAYIASHDLKEPLRGIHNYATFLLEDYSELLNEDGVSKLQTLVSLTQRMENLINSLLHFSRLGRIDLSMQRTDLNELVQQVVEVIRLSFKGIKVEIRIPQNLPIILCDKVQINEVFSNLISNAVKYNDKEDKWIEIGFLGSGGDLQSHLVPSDCILPEMLFYVRDNGIGIREKHHDAIFRIFKRLHAGNKYGGGTGAGLTIARKIVERHNGRIWVESTYGEGSTFYFTLPN